MICFETYLSEMYYFLFRYLPTTKFSCDTLRQLLITLTLFLLDK